MTTCQWDSCAEPATESVTYPDGTEIHLCAECAEYERKETLAAALRVTRCTRGGCTMVAVTVVPYQDGTEAELCAECAEVAREEAAYRQRMIELGWGE